jgi:hypothetical protein
MATNGQSISRTADGRLEPGSGAELAAELHKRGRHTIGGMASALRRHVLTRTKPEDVEEVVESLRLIAIGAPAYKDRIAAATAYLRVTVGNIAPEKSEGEDGANPRGGFVFQFKDAGRVRAIRTAPDGTTEAVELEPAATPTPNGCGATSDQPATDQRPADQVVPDLRGG